jgi:threonine dehydrogenase-like Zn-dependent dehydrogenase
MALSLWHDSEQKSSLHKEDFGVAGDGKLKIKSLYSLISTGTERLVASGHVPSAAFEAMAVPYMGGSFPFPVKYGYSLVGEVRTEGEYFGKIVHLLHPHQDICTVESGAVALVPGNIPAKRAILASNLETALNATWDARLGIGDKVLVAGFGMIGALLARVISFMPAVELIVLEKDPKRMSFAKKMGFNVVDKMTDHDYDVAFNTTSNEMALQQCIDAVGAEGRVVELSWYGTKKVTVNLGGDFHYKRKQLISSQVSQIPADHLARWDYKRRKEVVFKLLQSELFDEHITDEIAFEDAPDFFDTLRNGSFDGLGCCLKY